jgi:hypothetical protein
LLALLTFGAVLPGRAGSADSITNATAIALPARGGGGTLLCIQ